MKRWLKYILIGGLIGLFVFFIYLFLGKIFFNHYCTVGGTEYYTHPRFIRNSCEFFNIFNYFFIWVWFLAGALIGLLISVIRSQNSEKIEKPDSQRKGAKKWIKILLVLTIIYLLFIIIFFSFVNTGPEISSQGMRIKIDYIGWIIDILFFGIPGWLSLLIIFIKVMIGKRKSKKQGTI